jgi:hypothetical protein
MPTDWPTAWKKMRTGLSTRTGKGLKNSRVSSADHGVPRARQENPKGLDQVNQEVEGVRNAIVGFFEELYGGRR